MGKNNKLINSLNEIARRNRSQNVATAADQMVPQIYAAIAIALHRTYGFGYKRINDIFVESQHIWELNTTDYHLKENIAPNPLRRIPVVEFYLNDRMGIFEKVIPLMDAMNLVDSDRINDILQHVQSLLWMHNCQVNEEGKKNLVDGDGVIMTKSTGDGKEAKITYLNQTLNESEVQKLVDHLNSQLEQITSTPSWQEASGGSTTGAIYTGYISLQQSNKDCLFEENPIIYITQETACMYYGLQLMFGSTLPDGIIFRTFNDGKKVDEYEVNSDITKRLIVQHDFDDFDLMEIEFTKTKEPFNRIVVDYFSFGDITDFTMERQDMTSSPKSIKQELVKAVRVPCYSYQKGTAEETLISEETEAVKGDIQTYYLGDPTYGCRATFNSSASNVSIIESGDYYVTVKFLITGKYQFEIIGHRYNIVEQYAVKTLNSRGKTITWKNPLVSDMETANHLADWLGDYYNAGIEYEYNTRGNPEIDANDIVYQENAYRPGLKVNIYRHIVNFSQSLSGKVIARRVSEK